MARDDHRSDLLKLIIGNGVSTFGNAVYLIAVILLLKALFDSAFVLGLFQFLALIPAALLSPIVGTVVDSYSRRTILVVADVARAAVMLVAGALLLGIDLSRMEEGGRLTMTIGLLVVAFLSGIGNAFFVPAAQALIPSIVPRARLQSANGLRAASNQSFNLAGNAVGGALYALLGPALLLIVNGATFLLSGIGELWIGEHGAGAPRTPGTEDAAGAPAVADGVLPPRVLVREGFAALRGDRVLIRLFLSQFGLFAFSPTLVLALPFLVIDELGCSEATLGAVFAASLAGGVALFLLGRTTTSKTMLRREWPALAYAMAASAFLVLAVSRSLTTVIFAAFVFGGAAAAVYMFVTTAIQVRAAAHIHGRLFALLEAGNTLIAPLSYVATGSILDLLGADRRWYLFVAWAFLTGLWAAYLWVTRLRGRAQNDGRVG